MFKYKLSGSTKKRKTDRQRRKEKGKRGGGGWEKKGIKGKERKEGKWW